MPYAYNVYTGNGSATQYTIGFPYIRKEHVKVFVNYVDTAFTFANDTTAQLSSAPANGVRVEVRRQTPADNVLVDYTDGSTLTAADLDTNALQQLYLDQELDDAQKQVVTISSTTGLPTLGNQRLTNVSDPTGAQDAATKNYVDTNFQPVDAELTELATMSSGTASALADLTQTETQILDGATVTTAELNTLDGITASTAELNKLDGVTANTAELNKLDGVTASTAELNILDGVTATAAEINKLDGVTASTSELNTLDGVTATAAEINKLDGVTATTAELNFVDGVTSAIQSQIDGKQPLDAELTELATMPATTASALADLTQAEVQVLDGATLSTAELNTLDGITATAAELNVLDGSSATTADLNKLSAVSATSAELNKLDGITSSTSELNILDGVTATAAELNVADGITASTAELNQLDGKTISNTLTPANSNDIPTSSAVNTFVSGLLNALGGFVAIANENSFPTTNPDPSDNAGTVVSIADAGGMSVNSSGVGSGQTTAGTAVTITGFPSTFNGTTIQAGLGLQVQTTSTLNTYTYHKVYAKDEDVRQLSQDVDDFKARYRVGDSNPTTDLDSGDLFFNRGTGKMLVYNGQNTAWEEVQSIGEFFINTLSASTSTGGGSATFNGTAYRFTLSNAPTNAEQLLVSVNGVVQKPNSGTSQPSEGFAIDGSDIIFAAAPATSAPFFIITIGSSVNIGTPSAGTVGTAQLATSAVTNDKISSTAAIASSKLAKPIDFADNERARFGASQDLQIYHDGSNSWIKDTGTGSLKLQGTNLFLESAAGEAYLVCTADGSAKLYHNNSKKLETKSDGINIIGELECDSLDVDGNADVSGDINISGGNKTVQATAGFLQVGTSGSNHLAFITNGSDRGRVDSDGRLIVGSSSSQGSGRKLQIADTSAEAGIEVFRYVASPASAPVLNFSRSKNAALNSNTAVENNDFLGYIQFKGANGSGYNVSSQITGVVDGTPGVDDMPGRLVFSTSADGSSSPTERVHIDKAGNFKLRSGNQLMCQDADNHVSLQIGNINSGSNSARITVDPDNSGSGSYLQFYVDTAEVFRALNNNVRLSSACNGLQFNGDTALANALNDYEEGFFTPTLVGSSGGAATSYSRQKGGYVKVGNVVHVYGYLKITSKGSSISGNLKVGGFPFTVKNDHEYFHAPAFGWYTGFSGVTVYGLGFDIAPNSTSFTLARGTGTSVSGVALNQITDSFGVEWAFTYRTE